MRPVHCRQLCAISRGGWVMWNNLAIKYKAIQNLISENIGAVKKTFNLEIIILMAKVLVLWSDPIIEI